LKNEFVKIAKLISDQELVESGPVTSSKETCSLIFDAVLNLSIAAKKEDEIISDFINLMNQLIDNCSLMIPVSKHIVQRLSQELPISQSQQFWPLLIRLRAE